MLRSWKLFGLALIAALGGLMLVAAPGSPAQDTRTVLAEHDNRITVEVEGPSGVDVDFTITGTGCSPATFDLGDEETQNVDGCADGIVEVDSDPNAGFELDDITCSVPDDGDTGGNATTFTDTDTTDGDVNVNISDDEHALCVFTFISTATPTVTGTPATATPTVTGTPGTSTLTVSVTPTTLGCSGSAFVTVVARNAAGQVVAAGNVALATSLGTITPANAVDQGAGVLAVLTAPANQGGTATITATAGGATGQATVTINCAQATATSIPPTAVPQSPIVPPSTGDAGLAGGRSWQTVGGFTLLGIALAGAMTLAWRRARA